MTLPSWLPPMVNVNPWRDNTFDTLYAIFESDFKGTPLVYEGNPVWFFPEIEQGKEQLFWHLTHRDDEVSKERLPDLRRAERLPWIKSIIEHADSPEVTAWDYKEADGTIKTYLWLKEYDFLVLMKKYPDGRRRIITSYYIDYPHKRRKLEKKYSNRLI